ncbi:MAG: DUF2782 domain-containing protein [Betaproteobacteria bacterium]|nr:DUF2782 domain-containing protein [Betaproteobacteria bacterium]
MRRFSALITSLLFLAASVGFAQTPPKLEPIPQPPPPAPGLRDADLTERGVRIPVRDEDMVEPVIEAGRVIRYKVTPPAGAPYYLMDATGNGSWVRRDSIDTGLRAPLWQIYTFD